MKNTMNYVTNGDLIEMLIDRGHIVRGSDYLYEHCLKEDLEGKSILDYGCNRGNFLKSIPDDLTFTYTGIDVQDSFIESLSIDYPENTFTHFNKYHPSYNPEGNPKLKLHEVVSEKYDVIFAWNVFTHSTYEYTKECIEEMKLCLKDGGKIIFNLYSKESFVHLSNIMKGKNGTHTPITVINSFDNYAYWVNGTDILYDTTPTGNYSSLFACYDISWVDSDNSSWTLRENHENRSHTFVI